ncbi:MAG: DNA alkylation repair protein [Pelolinea sp.]|nr:DNA alkylation repair protein [Pelolinea sp.]
MNIPQVVINQLEISLKHLAQIFPDQTKIIAKNLWGLDYFETKKIAIFLISNLPKQENNYYFNKIEEWVDADIEQPIIMGIFENTNKITDISRDPQWLRLIETWLGSNIERIQKIGLVALTNHIRLDSNKNLPAIFRLVEPLLSHPHIAINNDLLNLVGSLIIASQPETAAFLIHLSAIYPKPELSSFIRKCLPLFDPYFSSEIKRKLTIL